MKIDRNQSFISFFDLFTSQIQSNLHGSSGNFLKWRGKYLKIFPKLSKVCTSSIFEPLDHSESRLYIVWHSQNEFFHNFPVNCRSLNFFPYKKNFKAQNLKSISDSKKWHPKKKSKRKVFPFIQRHIPSQKHIIQKLHSTIKLTNHQILCREQHNISLSSAPSSNYEHSGYKIPKKNT